MRAFLLFAAALLIVGCLEPGAETSAERAKRLGAAPKAATVGFDPQWAELAVFEKSGHNHKDPSHHEGRTTANFEILGWDPLVTDHYGRTSGGHLCGDTAEKNGKRLAVIHSWVSDVAAILIDVTDAAKPTKLGEFVMPNAHVYDLGMTPDQRFILLATDAGGLGPNDDDMATPLAAPYFEDACTGERTILAGPEQDLPYQNGVVLVDIANPKAPKFADYLFLGGGHSIQVKDLGGRTFALVTSATFSLIEVTAQGKLSPSSIFLDCGGTTRKCSYHDGALQIHPITKQRFAYVGDGTSLAIFNINDPSQPKLVGRWQDWAKIGTKIVPTFVHEVLPMEVLWDGRHYTFIGEECGSRRANTPTCMVALLDTTDPTKITEVGGWTLPIDVAWSGGFLFSLHYIGVSNRTLFVSNYHGGLWAVDVSTPEAMKTMPTIGVFQPTNVSPKPIGKPTSYDHAPAILDVNPLADGTLITYDHTSGVYAVRFDASNPAPAPPPWPLNG
ncbi:MAG TPA: hypothetical protein VI818_04200 [Candidatus Thermoplasmatota archaeon]|nr:hypothetical protein [Candidatus Thermoplasmatota archaeon]